MSKLPIHRAAAPKIKDKLTRGLGGLPQVEIIRPWRGYTVGARIRPPGVLRQVLLQQKIVKTVEDKPARKATRKPAKKAVKSETLALKKEPIVHSDDKPDEDPVSVEGTGKEEKED